MGLAAVTVFAFRILSTEIIQYVKDTEISQNKDLN
jgi:hypothetical protein